MDHCRHEWQNNISSLRLYGWPWRVMLTCWSLIALCKKVPYKEIADIDFTSPGALRRKLDKRAIDNGNPKIKETKTYSKANYASHEKVSEFYKSLSVCKSKPPILYIIPPYDEKYVYTTDND